MEPPPKRSRTRASSGTGPLGPVASGASSSVGSLRSARTSTSKADAGRPAPVGKWIVNANWTDPRKPDYRPGRKPPDLTVTWSFSSPLSSANDFILREDATDETPAAQGQALKGRAAATARQKILDKRIDYARVLEQELPADATRSNAAELLSTQGFRLAEKYEGRIQFPTVYQYPNDPLYIDIPFGKDEIRFSLLALDPEKCDGTTEEIKHALDSVTSDIDRAEWRKRIHSVPSASSAEGAAAAVPGPPTSAPVARGLPAQSSSSEFATSFGIPALGPPMAGPSSELGSAFDLPATGLGAAGPSSGIGSSFGFPAVGPHPAGPSSERESSFGPGPAPIDYAAPLFNADTERDPAPPLPAAHSPAVTAKSDEAATRKRWIGVLLAIYRGIEQARQGRATEPSMTVRRAAVFAELQKLDYAETTIYTPSRVSPYLANDGDLVYPLRVYCSGSRRNNPGQQVTEVVSLLSLDAFEQQLNGTAESLPDVFEEWYTAVETLAEQATSDPDGVDPAVFKQQVEALRPTVARVSRPAIRELPYRPEAHQLVRIALRSATGCGWGPRETMSTSNPIFDRMLEALLSRHVRSNSSDPKQLDVIDAFTGEVLATTSDEPVQFSKVYHSQTHSGLPLPVSIDHLNQVTLVFDEDGKAQTAFHTPENVVVCAPHINAAKHRYFSTILALFCGILDVAHNCGSVMTTAPAFAAVKRLIQLIAALYPPWPISCIHYERRKHSLQLILDAHDFVRKANDLLGIKMVAPPPALQVPEHALGSVQALSDAIEAEIAPRIERNFSEELDWTESNPNRQKLRDAGVTTARPFEYEWRKVPSKILDDVKLVGQNMLQEAHELGVDLLVNSDGIPALSVHGVDTLEDIARILQNNASSIKSSAVHRGVVELQHDIPAAEIYALVIAENVCRQLETGTPELRKGKLVLTSSSVAGVPFVVPLQNKGPFSPSASRKDHQVLVYETGFKRGTSPADLKIRDWFAQKASFGLDIWLLNAVMGAGDAAKVKRALERMQVSASCWIPHMEISWLLKDETLWQADDQQRYDKILSWIDEQLPE